MSWQAARTAVSMAKSIAYDGCHKIYVLLDDDQTQRMIDYGYRDNDTPNGARLYTSTEMTPEVMLRTLRRWWKESCPLRFIQSVRSVDGNPSGGFENLIPQFESGRR